MTPYRKGFALGFVACLVLIVGLLATARGVMAYVEAHNERVRADINAVLEVFPNAEILGVPQFAADSKGGDTVRFRCRAGSALVEGVAYVKRGNWVTVEGYTLNLHPCSRYMQDFYGDETSGARKTP